MDDKDNLGEAEVKVRKWLQYPIWCPTISLAITPNLSRTVQFVLNHHHLGKGEEKEACGGCGRSNYGENHTHTRYERAEKSPLHLGRKSN